MTNHVHLQIETVDEKICRVPGIFENYSARIDLTKEAANEIMNKIETTYPEGSEVVMTLAERFREEGMEEGEKKSMEKVVKKSIIKGLTTEDIIEITGLKKEEIEDIRKKMLS